MNFTTGENSWIFLYTYVCVLVEAARLVLDFFYSYKMLNVNATTVFKMRKFSKVDLFSHPLGPSSIPLSMQDVPHQPVFLNFFIDLDEMVDLEWTGNWDSEDLLGWPVNPEFGPGNGPDNPAELGPGNEPGNPELGPGNEPGNPELEPRNGLSMELSDDWGIRQPLVAGGPLEGSGEADGVEGGCWSEHVWEEGIEFWASLLPSSRGRTWWSWGSSGSWPTTTMEFASCCGLWGTPGW